MSLALKGLKEHYLLVGILKLINIVLNKTLKIVEQYIVDMA